MYGGKILYHYTDFQAIDGILRCAQLRVNNVLRMNDSAEMRHFMKRLCTAIADRLNREGSPRRAEEIWDLFHEELKKEYSAFAACFSFRRDDAAQWERYGNRGRGICIAMRRDCLQKMAKGALSLQTVFYQDDMAGHPMVEVFCRLAREGEALIGVQLPDGRMARPVQRAIRCFNREPGYTFVDFWDIVSNPPKPREDAEETPLEAETSEEGVPQESEAETPKAKGKRKLFGRREKSEE